MGITLGHRHKSIDMGCGGFLNLRKTIATLLAPSFGDLYEEWVCTIPSNGLTDEEGNARLAKLYENKTVTDDDDVVIEFLFASDIEGKLSAKGCKRLYSIIKDYDDNILYGYAGRPDCAKFKDFKEIVHDCANHRWVLHWY